jgi:hypothetical protein
MDVGQRSFGKSVALIAALCVWEGVNYANESQCGRTQPSDLV